MDFLSLGRLEESADVLGEALNIDAAATDIAQLQHNLLQQLGRQAEADELMQSTVAYLRTNRSAAAAAEFLIGCAGDPELTVDSTVALANLWQEADEAEKACEAIRHGMARASREENIEGQFALARRLIEIDPNDTEATGILLRHTASTAHDAEQRTLLAQLGENCMAAGNWGRATEAFVRLAEIAPDDETILSNLIRCHETCNEPEKAVRLRLHLGQSHFDAENWAKCAEALAPLAAGDALDTQALENLFQCHTRLNQKQEATEVGERLMQAAEKAGDAGAAIATIEQILELCPEDGSWRSRLFQWQLRAGQREDAVETGRTVLSHAIGAGDADRAREIAAQLVSLAPDDCKLRGEIISAYDTLDCSEEANRERLALAEVNRRAGAADEAQALYQQVLKSDPDSRAAGEGLLELHISVGDREGAVELLLGRIRRLDEEDQAGRIALLERLLQIDSDHTESRRRLVDLLRSQVRNDEAVEQLATLAQQLHDAGDHTEAIAAWEEVISLRPEVIPYHQALITSQLTAGADEQLAESVETLMRAMIARNEASEALECLDRFASYNPEIPLWARWRAEVLSEMGDSAQAVDAFRQAVALMQTQGATARPETREPANTRSMSFLPECTFDSFIIGDRNNFAHATCKAVAESPAKTYNPLFLYADVGLGKTHLVNAIGNHIQTNHPDLKILFITMEDFITGLVDAIQRNQIAEFRARHRRADVLLIDDVQFLANKERAQEEFFHLFNALHQSQRQIVITSDRPPREMTYLEKRLRSRFGAGVVVDIQSPDVETRLAILRQIAAGFEDTNLSDEVLALAAERCTSNVRELKGALTQLVAHAATNGGKLSAEQASHVLDQIIEPVES
jgi:chromosomal replication initiator protein DnaA